MMPLVIALLQAVQPTRHLQKLILSAIEVITTTPIPGLQWWDKDTIVQSYVDSSNQQMYQV